MSSCKNLLKKTPLIHEDTRLPQFAYALQKKMSAALCSALASVIWTNFLFVDQEDPSTTPERNSFTKKFGTIQAAIGSAEAGDVILVNPGIYAESLDFTNVPDNVTIQGAGATETTVINVGLEKGVSGTVIQSLTIRDLTINGTITVDTENVPNCFATGKLTLQDIIVGNVAGSDFNMVNNVKIVNVVFRTQAVFNNCSLVEAHNVNFNQELDLIYDFTETEPSLGRNEYRFSGCRFSIISPLKQVVAYFDSECVTQSIISTDLAYDDDAGEFPLITYSGEVKSDVEILFDYNRMVVGPPVLIGNFDHSEIVGRFVWEASDTSTANFSVKARNAVFETVVQYSISADGDNEGSGDSRCCMDLSNSTFNQIALDPMTGEGPGGIDRTLWTLDSTEIPETVTSIVIPIRYVNPTYTVHFELDGDHVPASNQGTVVVDTKAVDSFNATGSVAGIFAITKLIQNAPGTDPT
jgi:hypothetical protein